MEMVVRARPVRSRDDDDLVAACGEGWWKHREDVEEAHAVADGEGTEAHTATERRSRRSW
jgi:hypothetical protein